MVAQTADSNLRSDCLLVSKSKTGFFKLWSVDRYGRLISGCFVLGCSLAAIFYPIALYGVMLTGLSLVLTSLTNKCLLHDALMKLGAKEREDIFLPGGLVHSLEATQIDKVENECKRTSAISQAVNSSTSQLMKKFAPEELKTEESFDISIANNFEARKNAYSLAYEIYSECGYAINNEQEFIVSEHDGQSDTITFIAQDSKKKIIASVTVVSNVNAKLPCEEIFQNETIEFGDPLKPTVEITRFVIREEFKQSRKLLRMLMNYVYIYSHKIIKASHILIEVNPRHTSFYNKLLCFESFGQIRPCARVNGAPAVFMSLDLALAKMKIDEGREKSSEIKKKCLLHQFEPALEEAKIESLMIEEFKPMSNKEKSYFKIQTEVDLSVFNQSFKGEKANVKYSQNGSETGFFHTVINI